jgi:uncharacterized membrane protein SirB2
MFSYENLKALHIAAAFLSFAGFAVRAVWMWCASPRLHARWVRIVPHAVDTVLLASAVGLAWTLRQYPFVHGWLTAKVSALVLYIVLGAIGLHYGRTCRVRVAACGGAMLVFGYIAGVALAHDPLSWILYLEVI